MFHIIYATDIYGIRGSVGTVDKTVLSFTPGELSIVQGVFKAPDVKAYDHPTAAFDFRYLPCPPRSIMVS